MAAENGEEKLLAVARHIAKTLGHNDTMADDILQIFSNFDGRFSREKLSEKMTDDDPRAYAALEHTLKSLDRQISQYEAADQPIWADSVDSSSFLDTIDQLIATIRHWSPMAGEKSVGALLVGADDLMQRAMFRLENEFRSLMERGGESFELNKIFKNGESTRNLSSDSETEEEEGFIQNGDDNQIPVAQPITNYDIIIDALPAATVNDLHEIAKRMVAAGFNMECSHVYSSCRREFLEESMSRLGLQKLSIDEVQKMQWQCERQYELEDEIERWIKAANVALRILFPSERRLCDRVFFGFSSAPDVSFMEVCRESTIQLLNFADAVAIGIGSRSPERLFKILDMYETLRDLIPEFDSLFSDQYSLMLRNEAVTIWKRLGVAIKAMFMELEHLIQRDPAKAAVPGGGLHPITRYVMNYLRAACRSKQSLEQIFEENVVDRAGAAASLTSFSDQIGWIMELLESNLEMKSKIYKDSALCSIFLMNNGRYIVQKVKDCELGLLLGEDWIRKHSAKLRQYHANYQRSSLNKILAVLKLDISSVAANVVAKTMKDKLKLFNTYFEEMCKAQGSWVIFDEQLRLDLRVALGRILSPAYRNFIGRLQSFLEIGKNQDKYIKYSPEDIEARINLFFLETGGSAGGRK